MKKMKYLAIFGWLLFVQTAQAATIQVSNQQQLNDALAKAQPGDSIVLSRGEWKNAALVINSSGTRERPIVIAAAGPGAVQFTGNSYIRFGANYVTVSGIIFTNGYTEKGAIVEFRTNNDHLANYCRLTNCIFDDFNKPDRFANDNWLILWGQHNRIDHCTIGDKLTGGTTLIVELNDERSQQNYHQVDSNYFAGRSPLGSNGGEIIRVGVSRYALTSSHTQIHHNYFERCNGEVEVISVKSGDNEVNNNTFFECEGGLVLRHGSGNTVAGNVFVGNNKPNTAGVRIINPGHKVYNNCFIQLAGDRFRSGFSVLNGVPNSLPNRYVQVKDVSIHNNTFVDCKSIIFGAGKDPERTLSPQQVQFTNNFILTDGKELYEDANNDGGIQFTGNTFYGPGVAGEWKGFRAEKPSFKAVTYNGGTYKLPVEKNGAAIDQLSWMDAHNTGAGWHKSAEPNTNPQTTYTVDAAHSKDLPGIVAKARAGDIIDLSDTGLYQITAPLVVHQPVTITGKSVKQGKSQLVNVSEKSLPAFIIIDNGGSLRVENIAFNSAWKSFGDVQAGISTTSGSMTRHYSLYVSGCSFFNFNESSYSCIKGAKSTYADSVVIKNCVFHHSSGTGIDYSAEKDDKGIYNVEHLLIKDCVFTNMLSSAINVYRGGNDESTTGPEVLIDRCTFSEVDNRMQGCVVKLLGVQTASVTNCSFNKSGAGGRSIWFEEMSWDRLNVDYCKFAESGRVTSFFNKVLGKHNQFSKSNQSNNTASK